MNERDISLLMTSKFSILQHHTDHSVREITEGCLYNVNGQLSIAPEHEMWKIQEKNFALIESLTSCTSEAIKLYVAVMRVAEMTAGDAEFSLIECMSFADKESKEDRDKLTDAQVRFTIIVHKRLNELLIAIKEHEKYG